MLLRKPSLLISLTAALLAIVAFTLPPGRAAGQQATAPSDSPTPDQSPIDVEQLFATTCGWCHSDHGREAGKGPKLMGTARSDDYIRNRIRNGKEGAMPAFGDTFSDADLDAIVKYIRTLKPDQG